MKRHGATIVLVLAALALGLWLWLDRDKVTQGERSRREGSVFAAWRREELSRITIARPDETIVLERDAKKDSAWRLISPRQEKCDQAAVERLLTTLEFAVVVRKVSELPAEAPRAKLSVVMGGLTLELALGGPSPRPEGSSFAKLGSEPPIVVAKEVSDALLARSDVYRDRSVIPYLSTDLSRFSVKHATGGFTLERIDERSLRVAEEGVLLSRPGADRVWGALADMRAETFPSDADVDRLTASPSFTIVMTPKDGRPPAEIVVGEACPGSPGDVVVLRKTPTRGVACAPAAALEALRSSPSSLVETHPFTFRHDEMEEIRLERIGGETLELARKGTGFHMRAPADRDLTPEEADAASELAQRIAWSQAELVTRAGDAFVPVALAKIRMGEREEIVEIGPQVSDARWVLRRRLDGARLEVTPAVMRRLVPRRTTLRSRVLLGDARRVTRVNLRCGTNQDFVDAGEGLRLVSPAGYETDAGITSLVDAIVRGKVDAWISDTADASFGLEPSACRVVVVFEDGKDPRTIILGAVGESGLYGAIEGQPEVFVVPKSLKDLASGIYVSRSALRLPPDRAATITTPGRPPFKADPDALASLFADRVVRLGKPDLGPVSITIDAPPARIACGPAGADGSRACARNGIDATFELGAARFSRLLGTDAGRTDDGGPPPTKVARDAGPR